MMKPIQMALIRLFVACLMCILGASNAYADEWIQAAVKNVDGDIVAYVSISNAHLAQYPITETTGTSVLTIDRVVLPSGDVEVCAIFRPDSVSAEVSTCHPLQGDVVSTADTDDHRIGLRSSDNSGNAPSGPVGGVEGMPPLGDWIFDDPFGGGFSGGLGGGGTTISVNSCTACKDLPGGGEICVTATCREGATGCSFTADPLSASCKY